MEEVREVLEDYRRLGRLAVKILAYRFRIFTAVMVLSINSIFSVFYLFLGLLEIVGSMPKIPLLGYILWITPFILVFLLTYVLLGIFKKTFIEIPKRIKPREKFDINVGLIFVIAYTVPFILVNTIPVPLPYWESYGWYYALLAASTIVTVFYEKRLSKVLPELSIKIFYTITVLLLVFSPIPFALTVFGNSELIEISSSIIVTLCYLIASLMEVYRAERLA